MATAGDKVDPVEVLGIKPNKPLPYWDGAAAGDVDRFLTAVRGREIDDALQQVGAGIPLALELQRQQAEPVASSVDPTQGLLGAATGSAE